MKRLQHLIIEAASVAIIYLATSGISPHAAGIVYALAVLQMVVTLFALAATEEFKNEYRKNPRPPLLSGIHLFLDLTALVLLLWYGWWWSAAACGLCTFVIQAIKHAAAKEEI